MKGPLRPHSASWVGVGGGSCSDFPAEALSRSRDSGISDPNLDSLYGGSKNQGPFLFVIRIIVYFWSIPYIYPLNDATLPLHPLKGTLEPWALGSDCRV